MKVITLLTDFGLKDPYVAQMKGVILSIAKDVKIIDISHEVHPQNIEQGAFLLYTSIPYFPKGSIHVAVVDPGVGTSRRGIIIDCKDYTLVGPDNGLLVPAARRCENFKVYEIVGKKYTLDKITYTFHGRDVFAPIAAYIANGISLADIGREIEDYVDFNLEFGKVCEDKINGKIFHIDRFGNLITNIEEGLIKRYIEYGERIDLIIKGRKYRVKFLKSYGYSKEGEILLTIGGIGFLEISVNKGSASRELGASIGDRVTLVL